MSNMNLTADTDVNKTMTWTLDLDVSAEKNEADLVEFLNNLRDGDFIAGALNPDPDFRVLHPDDPFKFDSVVNVSADGFMYASPVVLRESPEEVDVARFLFLKAELQNR